MKKLLLVLLVVALASFLLVGCFGVPDGTEGEGEGEPGICPTVTVSEQQVIGTKTYIKGGEEQTITVTFAVPTEPVSVYIGLGLRVTLEELLQKEVVMYANADKTVYTGEFEFGEEIGGCSEAYIYVETCGSCAPCKFPYTVDTEGPESEITITGKACTVCPEAGFCDLIFKTYAPTVPCDDVYCGDACSGFASYTIDLYTVKPFDTCCIVSCATVYKTATGTTCPVNNTIKVATTTTETSKTYYMVATLLDKVGNQTRYYATLALDSGCGLTVTEYTENVDDTCSNYTAGGHVGATIGSSSSL